MINEIKFKVSSQGRKFAIVSAVVLAALLTFYSAKWGFANAISSRAEFVEISAWAAELAPADPQTRYANAVVLNATFDPTDAAKAVEEFQDATALSPHNYLLWLDLGKAFERKGDAEKSIAALERSLELAPNYAMTQWVLGNALLRQGETTEAVTLILRSAERETRYADPAANAMWQLASGDIASVEMYLASSPNVRSKLIPILSREKKIDEALRIWKTLDPIATKSELVDIGRTLYHQLIEAKRFRDALSVISAVSTGPISGHAPGMLRNGGFEEREQPEFKTVFDWRFADGAEPRIGLSEGQKRAGSFSLLLSFPANSTSFRNVSLFAAAEPGMTYAFEIFYRSELDTKASLKWEIVNAADGKRIGITEPVVRTTEWGQISAGFTMPDSADGIEIRLISECPQGVCNFAGNVWFDDAAVNRVTK